MADKKQLSEEMLKFLVANSLKKDKFVVLRANVGGDSESIDFEAKSESGMITVSGTFADPQPELELEPDNEPPGDH